MSRARPLVAVLLGASLVAAGPLGGGLRVARAQTAEEAAARHFDRAMELLQRSDYAAAALELEAAHAASPHPAVLHDLAEARAAAGQPLGALEAFDQYARQLSAEAPAGERQRVALRVAELERLVAVVDFDVAPPEARVLVDRERELGDLRSLRLPPGPHEVALEVPGREPQVLRLQLAAGERRTLQLRAPPSAPAAPAILTTSCAVPGVRLTIGGHDLGASQQLATGWAHVVEEGIHSVRFARAGYAPQVERAQLVAGRETRVACQLVPLPLRADSGSRLVLSDNLAGAQVLVDGQPFSGDLLVPGPHQLEVRRFGYQPVTLALQARAGVTQQLDVELLATPELEAWQAERRGVRQAWALALGGAGVATSGTALGVYLHSRARRESWQQTQLALNAEWQSAQPGSDIEQRQRRNDRRKEAFHRWNKASVGLGAAGVLLLAGGATLWWLVDESDGAGGLGIALGAAPRLEWSGRW